MVTVRLVDIEGEDNGQLMRRQWDDQRGRSSMCNEDAVDKWAYATGLHVLSVVN